MLFADFTYAADNNGLFMMFRKRRDNYNRAGVQQRFEERPSTSAHFDPIDAESLSSAAASGGSAVMLQP